MWVKQESTHLGMVGSPPIYGDLGHSLLLFYSHKWVITMVMICIVVDNQHKLGYGSYIIWLY